MSKYRGNLVHVAEAVRSHGRGGDDILVHVNPEEFDEMKHAWGPHSVNPHTGLPEYGLFKKLKKALKFEAFNVKNIVKDVIKDPQRLLTGAIDPLGTKITNKMFGTNYDPVVNQLGGATEQRFKDAEAQGMDTGLARNLHKAAGMVAGAYGAAGLGNLAGAGISNLSQPAAEAVGGSSAITGAGSGLGQAALDPALSEVSMSALTNYQLPSSVAASLGDVASTGVGGLADVSTSALDNYQLPSSVTNSLNAANPGLGQQALNYAKDMKNWPTIAKGVTAIGGLASAGGGEEGPPPPAPYDPGAPLDVNYPGRQFQDADYSKYYNYGEGPEHSYYTLGPMPKEVWVNDPHDPQMGLAEGGGVPKLHYSGLGSPLSSEARYMQDGPGGGQDDEIDAKLSPKEYVFDATTVAMLGDGNPDHGAKKLDEMRRKLWKDRGKHYTKGKLAPKAKDPEGYL